MLTFALLCGGTIGLRPLARDEGPLLAAGIAQLSPRSIWLRFHTLRLGGLSKAELDYLTGVDQRDHAAWVVEDRGTPVGLGRYVRLGKTSDTAEVALTILDAWQGRGLSKVLLAALMANAWVAGIARLRAAVLSDNILAWRLLASLGAVPHPVAGDEAHWAELDTDPDRLPATAAAAAVRRYHRLILD